MEKLPSFCVQSSKGHFRDVYGRTLMLRGVNATGSAKTPIGQPGSKLEGFWEGGESGDMSFVGRTFDIESGAADVHLARLREWGFNALRFVFTWEGLEHKGPGKYDEEYVRYLVAMLRKCKAYGFYVIMDPHQDVFSRFSGGSGAPYWAVNACGMNPRNFTATGAAYIQCEWRGDSGEIDPGEFPDMLWATNYTRLAVQTMNTLFWAGKDFAPLCVIDGVNIQDWLQTHYFNAVRYLGKALAEAGDLLDCCVVGWDSLNEPNEGLIGARDLTRHDTAAVAILRIGPTPTAFEGMRLGMGERLEVERWKFSAMGPKKNGTVVIDPEGKSCWLSPESEPGGVSKWGWTRSPEWKLGQCVWALHGVWDPAKKMILRKDYFYRNPKASADTDGKADFARDYWRPHWQAYASVIKEIHYFAIHFIQPPIFQIPPMLKKDIEHLKGRACHSSHFYDGLTLVTKHWNWFNADALGMVRGEYSSIIFALRFGEAAIRKVLRKQLQTIRQDTFDYLGDLPTIMGEIGIPYDLDHKEAYRTGDYHNQARALDASLNACDGPRPLNYTIWTYTPDNEHWWGDQWNGEDLSIWSRDDAERCYRQRAERTASMGTNGVDTLGIGGIKLLTDRVPYSASPSGSTESLEPTSLSPSTEPLRQVSASQRSDFGLLAQLNRSRSDLPKELSYLDLNDGSRGLPAFCRPHPRLIVGEPLDIQFDLKSSVFTMTVKVCHGDIPDDAPEKLATEIYLPLVHYAALPTAVAQAVRNDEIPDTSQAANGSGSPAKLNMVRTREPADARSHPDALDLDVEVDEGTSWEAEGQTLKWFYPRPLKESSKPLTFTLTVKRASGPIQTWRRQYGHDSVSDNILSDLLQCPPKCVVM